MNPHVEQQLVKFSAESLVLRQRVAQLQAKNVALEEENLKLRQDMNKWRAMSRRMEKRAKLNHATAQEALQLMEWIVERGKRNE